MGCVWNERTFQVNFIIIVTLPPKIAGCRVLTRPPNISGDFVKSDTRSTGMCAFCRYEAVPPDAIITKFNFTSSFANSSRPDLSETLTRTEKPEPRIILSLNYTSVSYISLLVNLPCFFLSILTLNGISNAKAVVIQWRTRELWNYTAISATECVVRWITGIIMFTLFVGCGYLLMNYVHCFYRAFWPRARRRKSSYSNVVIMRGTLHYYVNVKDNTIIVIYALNFIFNKFGIFLL